MGYFDEMGVEALLGNVECNSLAAIRISHFMYERMVKERRGGLIAFVSSSAWFIPAPYAAMYAGTYRRDQEHSVRVLPATVNFVSNPTHAPPLFHSCIFFRFAMNSVKSYDDELCNLACHRGEES